MENEASVCVLLLRRLLLPTYLPKMQAPASDVCVRTLKASAFCRFDLYALLDCWLSKSPHFGAR